MRIRRVLLVAAIVGTLGAAGYLAWRSPWVRAWFARDSENPIEIARLAEKKLDQPPVSAAATGWPQWRGPLRDGRAPAGPLRTNWDEKPPAKLWQAACGGGYGSCAVVDGRLFVQDRKGEDERVLCLDAANGNLLWEYGYPSEQAGRDRSYAIGPRATPTISGDRLYCVGGAGKLLCLKLSTAPGAKPTLAWEHDLLAEFNASLPQWGVACSPLIEDDLVVVQPGGEKSSVVALDKNTGAHRWSAGDNPPSYSSPVAATIGGRRMIFAFTSNALLAIRAEDGKVTGSYSWRTMPDVNVATPLVIDEYVFISSGYGMGCALLHAEPTADGAKLVAVYARRKPPGIQNHHQTCVFKDRHLFGFDGNAPGHLKCVEFDTGKFVEGWSDEGEVGKGSVILAGDHLVIQTERGDLALVEANPKEFRLLGKVRRVLSGRNNWASPTLVDGRLYLRDEEKVVCYDVR
jgi:outer membrane protein assembly factor BamB